MFVLDEPSIGLHQRDNARLLQTLQQLRDIGNTVIVVEHDEDAIRIADYVVDIGPGAGVHGGAIVAEGEPDEVAAHPQSLTGAYLSGEGHRRAPGKSAAAPIRSNSSRSSAPGATICRMSPWNCRWDYHTCVTGFPVRANPPSSTTRSMPPPPSTSTALPPNPQPEEIEGLDLFDKVINVDQSPIGRTRAPTRPPTPDSSPPSATSFRRAGSPRPRLRTRTLLVQRQGGRCEACQGDGMIKVEMHFLPDIYVPCDVCHGKRYNRKPWKSSTRARTFTKSWK